MDSVRTCYRRDLWAQQESYMEVFVEKDAMAGVLEPITEEYDITLNVIRGDPSETFVHNVAAFWNSVQKPITALYFGDHDPSGLRIEQTLVRNLRQSVITPFHWTRMAVTETDFHDPANLGFPLKGERSAKVWQTKNNAYLERYGDRCVEVDALHPNTIRQRLKAAIESHINQLSWQALKRTEELERDTIQDFVLAHKIKSLS